MRTIVKLICPIFIGLTTVLPAYGAIADSPTEKVIGALAPNTRGMAVNTIVRSAAFFGIIALAALALKRRDQKLSGQNKLPITIISRAYLGQKNSVQIIEVNSKRYLIGVADGSTTLLTELPQETVEATEGNLRIAK